MEAIKRRRMVRAFDPERMIDRARLSAMLELAVQAPSAGFSQGWHFTVLDDSSGRSLFWTATTDSAAPPDRWLAGMQSAPVLIVVWSERAAYDARYARFDKSPTPGPDRTLDARWPVAYWDIDAGMAALLILLAATEDGLGSCLFGVPPSRVNALRDTLGMTVGFVPVAVLALGYPDVTQPGRAPRPRRAMTEVVSYGRYGRS
jgi:nitroreductase